MIVTTAAEMRRLDAFTIERCGIPAATLMERAGSGAAEVLLDRFPHVRKAGVLVVAGKGNNGGDGFVLARALKRRRVRCEVVLAATRGEIGGPARDKLRAWERMGGRTTIVAAGNLGPVQRAFDRTGCVVDAIFGTGLTREVTGVSAELITLMNASGLPTVALDVPSGLDADRGEALGVAIEAELTIAFAAAKIGTVVFPGARHAGALAVVDIGIPDEAFAAVLPRTHAMTGEDAARLLQPRAPEGHKGDHGHVAVVAGSRGKTGAAVLAARAAARAGAGLVTVGCPDSVQPLVASALLEEMSVPLPDADGSLAFDDAAPYTALLTGKRAVLIGPGLGVGPTHEALVRWLVTTCRLPVVVDADGLNCLAVGGRSPDRKGGALVFTPHPGEMSRLAGIGVPEVQSDRIGVARRVAASWGAVVVLKGARTITAEPAGEAWINLSGNAGLGTGGTGDVLAGMIASLLAQGYHAAEAARLAVFLHGAAADRIAARTGMVGMLASDVIAELPATMAALATRLDDP